MQLSSPFRLLGATVLLAAAAIPSTIATPINAEFEPSIQPIFARQEDNNQGIGGAGSTLPPGVKQPPNVPFNGNDSLAYSPPSYPSPEVEGTGVWAEPVRRAREYIKQFNLEERVKLVTGQGWQIGQCVGNIAPQPKHGFDGMCLQDSPLGVRFADLVNVFPAGVTTAATFDADLAYRRGVAMGEEFRAKGVNVYLGPGLNINKYAAGGRNYEYGGADPYLSGEAAHFTVKGLQSVGVQANTKHFIANEQEHFRNEGSSNVDGRSLREIYLHPFLRAIQADLASVMCAYNKVNNSWACQNSYILNDVLKTELGFQGYVVTDWGAQHAGVASANAGLDMTMPGDEQCCFKGQNSSFWGKNLTMSVNNGSVEAKRVEDMGVRILASYFLLGQDKDYPKPNFDFRDDNSELNEHVNINKLFDHAPIIREVAAAGTVLLKNKKKKNGYRALPLAKPNGHTPNKLAIIGSDAGPAYKGANFYGDRAGTDGVVGEGWGSGTAEYSILISPYEALQARAVKDGTGFYWSFDDYNYKQARKISDERAGIDAAVVFLQSDSGEGYLTVEGNTGDRNNLTAWHDGDRLVKEVASVNSNTIVVIHNPAQMDVEAWVENDNVTAVIFAHMGGRESGNAIADVLYGDYVPSGRLPYTVAKNRSDYSEEITYVNTTGTPTPQLNYTDKLEVDYRHFDSKGIEPRYEFGFGLSYSTFVYSGANGHWLADSNWNSNWSGKSHRHGLPSQLWEDVYEFEVSITNTGDYDAHEVPQAYLSYPESAGEPPKVLRKFERVFVKKGDTKLVKWKLNRYDFSIWSNKKGRWIKPKGDFKLLIGSSSRKIHQRIHV
ncbi:unnamed protein product [Sympodiomycopsis kandeliae]